MRRLLILLAATSTLAACSQQVSPERAAEICEERAQAAQGPTGEFTIGANSNSGPYYGASIGVTSDYLQGRDPMAVYETCVVARTGQMPIRPPVLR